MAVIKRVITTQEREQARKAVEERQKQREELRERLSQKAQLSQDDINKLVMVLAREHGLIE